MYPTEAYPVMSKLESEGIKCFLDGEHTVSAHPFLSNAIGGIKLNIMESDTEKALEILAQEEAAFKKDREDKTTSFSKGFVEMDAYCKKCESRSVFRKKFTFGKNFLAIIMALLYLPLMFMAKEHYCADCGYVWKQ